VGVDGGSVWPCAIQVRSTGGDEKRSDGTDIAPGLKRKRREEKRRLMHALTAESVAVTQSIQSTPIDPAIWDASNYQSHSTICLVYNLSFPTENSWQPAS
jgi:hypothetical protein